MESWVALGVQELEEHPGVPGLVVQGLAGHLDGGIEPEVQEQVALLGDSWVASRVQELEVRPGAGPGFQSR